MILDYEPLSRIFHDVGQAIRAGDSKLARIDVSKSGFLSRRDLLPVELPIQHAHPQVADLREDSAFSCHTLDAEIDQFRFEEAEGTPERLVELSDSEHESDRYFAAHPLKLIVARVDAGLEVEEEGMNLKPRPGLKGLLANRNKGSTSKEVTKT